MNIVRANRPAVESGRSVSEDTQVLAPARSGSRLWLPLVALVTAMLSTSCFRLVPWVGDEGILLHGADRMLRGSKLYADFFEVLPPGGFVLTALWFNVAGISFESARILAILTIIGVACFTFLACRNASRNAPLSAFLVIGWAMSSQGPWTQVSHHWFTTLFVMVGAWAVLAGLEAPQRQLRWPLIAGMMAGAAAMVTPTRGVLTVLAALVAFLPVRNRAGLIAYVLAVVLAPAVIVAYLSANHSLTASFDGVIRFAAARYAPVHGGVPFGHDTDFVRLPLFFLFPLAALLTFLVCVRGWRACLRDHLLRVCVAFGLGGFIGCFPRPDIGHIAYAVPLACPLVALCMTRLTQRPPLAFQNVFAAAAIALCVLSAVTSLRRVQIVLESEIVPTQRGGVRFIGYAGAAEIIKHIDATPRADGYFFYPYMPLLPFLAAREHVAKYDIFIPSYTLPSQYHDACLSVMRRASWVVIDHTWIGPGKWQEGYPAMPDALPQETMDFERVLDRGFESVARYGTFELRRLREDSSEALCTRLAGAIVDHGRRAAR